MKKKIVFNAPVVLLFSAVCLLALLLNYATGGRSNRLLFMTYHSSPANPLTYIRFFTHAAGHADWDHFAGNMIYILLLGPMLEEKYTSRILLELILITALVTGVINYLFFPNTALCGASGIVFAFILLASFTNFKAGEIPLTFILAAVFYLGQQVLQGLDQSNQISNMAHITGGIIGSMAGYALQSRKRRNH